MTSDPYLDAFDARVLECNTCRFHMFPTSWARSSQCLLLGPSFTGPMDDDPMETDTHILSPCALRQEGQRVSVDTHASPEAQAAEVTDPIVHGLLVQGAARRGYFPTPVDVANYRITLLSGIKIPTAHARVKFLQHMPAELVLAAQALLTDAEDRAEVQAAVERAKAEDTRPSFGTALIDAILKTR